MDALHRIFLQIEDATDLIVLRITELKRRIKNLPSENPFDFERNVEMQEE